MANKINEKIERVSNMLAYITDDIIALIHDTEAELEKVAREKGQNSEAFEILQDDWNFLCRALNQVVYTYESIGNTSAFDGRRGEHKLTNAIDEFTRQMKKGNG